MAAAKGEGAGRSPTFPGEFGTIGLFWLVENTNVTHSSGGRGLGGSCPL